MKKVVFVLFILILSSTNVLSQALKKVWETDKILLTPESVVFDESRNFLYVSNFNVQGGFLAKGDTSRDEFISKVSLDGEIINLKWIEYLNAPTGLAIHNDKLFVVERSNLVEIDLNVNKIINRYSIANSGFLNDIVIDPIGTIYLSDTKNNMIFKFSRGEFEIWLDHDIDKPNGLLIDNDKLIVGSSGDKSIKIISLKNKTIDKVIETNSGIDGLKINEKGDYIISCMQKISLIGRDCSIVEILNTDDSKIWNTDFEYLNSTNLIIVPTFFHNKLIAYKLSLN